MCSPTPERQGSEGYGGEINCRKGQSSTNFQGKRAATEGKAN